MDNPAPRRYRHIEVRPIAGALGAEIEGVDAARALAPEVVAELRSAFLDYLVIFLRGQKLAPEQLLAFARRFGEPMEYPQLKGLPECPLVTPVIKLEHERVNFGGVWHSDTSYLERPPMASLLYAVQIPPYGGDTLFANQYAAYESLSEGLKRALAGLIGVNTSAKAEVSRTREDRLREAGAQLKVLVGEHPVVRTHPETGRKALYVNAGHTARFKGWTEQESAPLLEYLFRHQVSAEFTCRFRWAPGSLAFWDNRCTLHYPVNDYHGFRRIMHRVTLAGDKPC
ncbi:MAG TPA: TauD/TfdA family dioxygenase [Burkholderiales bacterium]|nr:TauD/TfdA family dioxygenase [Burkholderiales bacterium]